MKSLRKRSVVLAGKILAGIFLVTILSLSVNFYIFAADAQEQLTDDSEGRFSGIFGDMLKQLISAYPDKSDSMRSYRLQRELRLIDPKRSKVWEQILPYWDEVNSQDFVNIIPPENIQEVIQNEAGAPAGILPADLPDDDSLCIVVLGFDLNDDGSMSEELIDRLKLALACAMQYPDSYVLVSGGGTAKADPSVTEADSMAQWLKENGLDQSRIIIENKSMTTVENAIFSCGLLTDKYPQVKNLVITTSDYHISTGCLLFQTQFWLMQDSAQKAAAKAGSKEEYGLADQIELNVCANAGARTNHMGSIDMDTQALRLAALLEKQ